MTRTVYIAGLHVVLFCCIVRCCLCVSTYATGCVEIPSNTTKLINCSSDRLIWTKKAWWDQRNFHNCKSVQAVGQKDVTAKVVDKCDNRSSCNITNKLTRYGHVIVYYYCKERNCTSIPIFKTGNITCNSSSQRIVVEEAWVDLDRCVKSATIDTKTNISGRVSTLCDGKPSCSVPYVRGKYLYANIKYHCNETSTTSLPPVKRHTTQENTISSDVQTTQIFDSTTEADMPHTRYMTTEPSKQFTRFMTTDIKESTMYETTQGFDTSSLIFGLTTSELSNDLTTHGSLTSSNNVATLGKDTSFGLTTIPDTTTTQDFISSTQKYPTTTKRRPTYVETSLPRVKSTKNPVISTRTTKSTPGQSKSTYHSTKQRTTVHPNTIQQTHNIKAYSQRNLNVVTKRRIPTSSLKGTTNQFIITTYSGRSMAKDVGKPSLSTISLVAIVCSVSTMLVVVVLIICYVKRRKSKTNPRGTIEMHNPQYDVYNSPDKTKEIETEFQQKEKYPFREHDQQNQNLYNSNTLFLGMHSGSTETSTDSYDRL